MSINQLDLENALRGGFAGPRLTFTATGTAKTNAVAGKLPEGAYEVDVGTNGALVFIGSKAAALAATTGERVLAGGMLPVYSDGDDSATGQAYLMIIRDPVLAADATVNIVGISANSYTATPPAMA